MSYILDALRKSEEQRRLASTPDLGTEHRPAGSAGRGSTRLLALLGAALLLNALVVGAWLFWPRDAGLGSPGEASTTRADSPLAGSAPTLTDPSGAPADIRGPVGETAADGHRAPAVPRLGTGAASGSTPGARPSSAARYGETGAGTGPEGPTTAGSTSGFPQNPDTDLRAPGGDGIPSDFPATTPARTTAPIDASRSGPGADTRQAPATGREQLAATTSPASAAPPVPIRALPDEFRQRIGPLSFSTHIYADEPRFREVAINGRMHREGARLGAMRLIEITEEGVILELEGRRFSVSVLQEWDY